MHLNIIMYYMMGIGLHAHNNFTFVAENRSLLHNMRTEYVAIALTAANFRSNEHARGPVREEWLFLDDIQEIHHKPKSFNTKKCHKHQFVCKNILRNTKKENRRIYQPKKR